jgi:hypothetical protein
MSTFQNVPEMIKRELSSSTLAQDVHRIVPMKSRPEATIKTLKKDIISTNKASISLGLDTESYKPMDNGRFRRRIQEGVVDVWWLFDDGGLELLLAHLLTKHPSYLQVNK